MAWREGRNLPAIRLVVVVVGARSSPAADSIGEWNAVFAITLRCCREGFSIAFDRGWRGRCGRHRGGGRSTGVVGRYLLWYFFDWLLALLLAGARCNSSREFVVIEVCCVWNFCRAKFGTSCASMTLILSVEVHSIRSLNRLDPHAKLNEIVRNRVHFSRFLSIFVEIFCFRSFSEFSGSFGYFLSILEF